jgi:hypothetical protein
MRVPAGRRAGVLAAASLLGVVALGGSGAAVVSVLGHRPPASRTVAARPAALTFAGSPAGPALPASGSPAAAATSMAARAPVPVTASPPPPAALRSPARPPAPAATDTPGPSTVSVDETTAGVTVRPGTLISVRLHGTPASRWDEPQTTTPQLLERLSASSTPDGNATATFRAVASGDAVVLVQRGATCSSGPAGGVCGSEARRIRVTITAS